MACVKQGDHNGFICHPHTNDICCLYSSLSHKTSPPFGWYSLCLRTKGWPGWIGLGGWLHTGTGHWTQIWSVGHTSVSPRLV